MSQDFCNIVMSQQQRKWTSPSLRNLFLKTPALNLKSSSVKVLRTEILTHALCMCNPMGGSFRLGLPWLTAATVCVCVCLVVCQCSSSDFLLHSVGRSAISSVRDTGSWSIFWASQMRVRVRVRVSTLYWDSACGIVDTRASVRKDGLCLCLFYCTLLTSHSFIQLNKLTCCY